MEYSGHFLLTYCCSDNYNPLSTNMNDVAYRVKIYKYYAVSVFTSKFEL